MKINTDATFRKYLVALLTLTILGGCQFSRKKAIEEKSKSSVQESQESQEKLELRSVSENVLISRDLPKIEIKVDDEFKYVGSFEFEIIASSDEYSKEMLGKPVAAGDRFVFSKNNENGIIEKLFVVQLEGFLPSNDLIYNYNFDNSEFIGNNKYRHNTWFHDGKKSSMENPKGEGALTLNFLQAKGLKLADELMMSRFVGLASDDRKNEIIIFYFEMLKNETGYSLDDWENSVPREEKVKIDSAFVVRSKKSFTIISG